MPDTEQPLHGAPEARAVPRRRTHLSLVWLIPIVAAIAGAWVTVTRILAEGPEIQIVFRQTEGLEAGKTKIEYNGVQVGSVTGIRLSEDHQRVIVTAKMAPETDCFLVEDTRFWIVRPRVSATTVSGLGTIVSGAYVRMEIGGSSTVRRQFEGLENPPVVAADVPGCSFVLTTPDLGSLDHGTPVYFRRLKVGEVESYELAEDGHSLNVTVFVQAPYDQYVTPATRFWQASGIDVSLSAAGLNVQTQSIVSLLIGGVAFETPATGPVLPAAEEKTVFRLFKDRAEAFKPMYSSGHTYLVVFKQSVRGLAPGAPVEFRGIPVGEVVDVTAQIDPETFEFSVPVTLRLHAERVRLQILEPRPGVDIEMIRRELFDSLVARGVRAQLRTANPLTGSLYVALDFFPDALPVTMDWSQEPVQLPAAPGQLEEVQERIVSLTKELDEIPFKAIAIDLRNAIAEFNRTLVSARGSLDSATTLIEPNSVLEQQLDGTLQEVSGAARAVRLLAEDLERHPEALIRGKTGEVKE